MKKLFFIPALLTSFSLIFVACNQQQQATEQAIESNEERLDDDMEDVAEEIAEAYESNARLLRASEIAMQNETQLDQQLMDFVSTIQQDHESLKSEMENIASQNNIQIPQNINYDQQSGISELQQASGEEFKNKLLDIINSSQNNLMENMEEIADEAENLPELKNFAQQYMDNLKAHNQTLEQLRNASQEQNM